MMETDDEKHDNLLERVKYRTATPTDIFQCFDMEREAHPKLEAATKNDLRYRQHHAAPFFRCAVLEHEDEESDEDVVIGYITSTRCVPDENDVYETTHQPGISSLMIHSMVIRPKYQRRGLGHHMVNDYVKALRHFNATEENPIGRVILFAKQSLLMFYLDCGFSVLRPSRNTQVAEMASSNTSTLNSDTISNPNNNSNRMFFLELKLDDCLSKSKHLTEEGSLDCYIVDSFASAPGAGNPAAVVFLPKQTQADVMAKWMHTVAAEFNLSETAFCWPYVGSLESATALSSSCDSGGNDEDHWNIRYYTPKVEIPLCGHATLASAAIIYQSLHNADSKSKIVFHASEDVLVMEKAEADENSNPFRTRISMEFPLKPPKEVLTADDKLTVRMMLQAAFSCELDPLYVGVSDIGDVLIEIKHDAFLEIGYEKINFKAMMEWHGYYRGVIVCCLNDASSSPSSSSQINGEIDGASALEPHADFLSRFFGPKAGINEDPVTGSAHCVLAPYFSQKLNKDFITGKQTSSRGGYVECLVKDESVRLTGTAITTVTGKLWMKKEETSLRPRVKRERSSSIFDD